MTSAAEFVSQGHPDRTADTIASYLLDEYIKHDKTVRFALEVQLKDHTCNLAGEVTSTWKPTVAELENIVRDAIRSVGYTAEYAAKWPDGATLNAENVVVNNFIGQQSPDIAQGVDRQGWGDQGCFMGMATNEKLYGHYPRDRYLAHEIGNRLYSAAKNGTSPIGLDIKVLVSMRVHDVEQVVVAAPMLPTNEKRAKEDIEHIVNDVLSEKGLECGELIINGTGAYVIHSSVGDAGVVGRKLAVDFYGLNCPVGGGAPWGKDPTKADVTLNLAARYFALNELRNTPDTEIVYCKIACCIGQTKCLVSTFNENNRVISLKEVNLPTSGMIDLLRLREDNTFTQMCMDGLFSKVDKLAFKD